MRVWGCGSTQPARTMAPKTAHEARHRPIQSSYWSSDPSESTPPCGRPPIAEILLARAARRVVVTSPDSGPLPRLERQRPAGTQAHFDTVDIFLDEGGKAMPSIAKARLTRPSVSPFEHCNAEALRGSADDGAAMLRKDLSSWLKA